MSNKASIKGKNLSSRNSPKKLNDEEDEVEIPESNAMKGISNYQPLRARGCK